MGNKHVIPKLLGYAFKHKWVWEAWRRSHERWSRWSNSVFYKKSCGGQEQAVAYHTIRFQVYIYIYEYIYIYICVNIYKYIYVIFKYMNIYINMNKYIYIIKGSKFLHPYHMIALFWSVLPAYLRMPGPRDCQVRDVTTIFYSVSWNKKWIEMTPFQNLSDLWYRQFFWLVVYLPLWKMWKSVGSIIPR